MNVWDFLSGKLKIGQRAVLLYVVDNKGSSPGRKGFAMAVGEDGDFTGTIGGGIMEVKLLELARHQLEEKNPEVILKKQYHDKQHAHDQSGMICSGEQTVSLIPLSVKDEETILTIIQNRTTGFDTMLSLQSSGLRLIDVSTPEIISAKTKTSIPFIFRIPAPRRVHIFGGGHVGLALSQVLSLLDYQVLIYDDRPTLNTLSQNKYADQIRVIDYDQVDTLGDLFERDTVILVTFSYRIDKLILKQLCSKPFGYIGMMGSEAKIKKLFEELEAEGISSEVLSQVHAPIGLDIYSKTSMEIAISISAELIYFKNKDLPTGRKEK